MSRKVIAVDIDDVLSGYADALVQFSNKRWGTNLTVNDVHEDWAKMWQVDHKIDEFYKRADVLHKELFKDLEHRKEAGPVLKKLLKKYNLVITTSRQRKLKADTEQWLEKHFPGIFSNIHFAGIYDTDYSKHRHYMTKKDVVEQAGADYLIDDQLKHCLAVAESGKTGLLFGDYPWNQGEDLPDSVIRVRDWEEVGDYFGV